MFANVLEFVNGYLARMIGDDVGWGPDSTRRWCPEWWRHPAAVSRLQAVWRGWEYFRSDPATGASVWWRDHADYQIRQLMDPNGPFRYCSVEDGHKYLTTALPLSSPPQGMFDTFGHEG
jgi:hypothetical protein